MVDSVTAGILGLPIEDQEKVSTARQLAELIDKTELEAKEKQRLAFKAVVLEEQTKVHAAWEALNSATDSYQQRVEEDTERKNDAAEDLARLQSSETKLLDEVSMIVPFSVFPVHGVQLFDALLQDMDDDVSDPDAARDFRQTLDDLSFAESRDLTQSITALRQIEVSRQNVIKLLRLGDKHHPEIVEDCRKLMVQRQEEYDTAVGRLRVAQADENQFLQSLDKSISVSVNVKSVSAKASIGSIVAKADAEIIKADASIKDADTTAAERKTKTKEVEEDNATMDALILQMRVVAGLNTEKIINWKKVTRTKSKTKAHDHAVKALNDQMPDLINREYLWNFIDKHGREMLALRAGVVVERGPVKVRILDRWDERQNQLICFFPDFKKVALVIVEQKIHGEFRIKTIMNHMYLDDWTHFEENTEGVPMNVKNMVGVTLEQYAHYHQLIVAHAEAEEKKRAREINL